ncbi:MAG TPA: adenylosuccinate synthetase, partial [Bacillota bacterium]|nr:adenylosuccinate synthetase [Bacillota bacterium]
VGAGPFVGELFGNVADELRRRGGSDGEYGATTGRPRRMAWFDAVAARYGCMLQGATEVALTLVDVLGYLERIPVCTGYIVDGNITRDFPETYLLHAAEPVYEYLEGWHCDISGVRSYKDLPYAAKKYIDFIEEQLGVPVKMVSNGPRRDQMLYR